METITLLPADRYLVVNKSLLTELDKEVLIAFWLESIPKDDKLNKLFVFLVLLYFVPGAKFFNINFLVGILLI